MISFLFGICNKILIFASKHLPVAESPSKASFLLHFCCRVCVLRKLRSGLSSEKKLLIKTSFWCDLRLLYNPTDLKSTRIENSRQVSGSFHFSYLLLTTGYCPLSTGHCLLPLPIQRTINNRQCHQGIALAHRVELTNL